MTWFFRYQRLKIAFFTPVEALIYYATKLARARARAPPRSPPPPPLGQCVCAGCVKQFMRRQLLSRLRNTDMRARASEPVVVERERAHWHKIRINDTLRINDSKREEMTHLCVMFVYCAISSSQLTLSANK